MMPVIKHFDPVMGIDIHIVTIPPVGPVPIPHPHIALILDPMDYIPIIGASVLVGGIPRGTAGTAGKVIPHIPMGGPFVKPPGNEDEIFMGSATVLADGSPLSFTALPVLGCQDIGMISPIRLKKPKKTYGMVLPTSMVMGIPAGMPVLVGGPPTIDMMAMAMKVGFAALGKALKKLRALQKRSARFKKLSQAVHERAKKIMDKLGVPPNIRNKVHKAICTVTGHPVDVAAGKLFTDAVDFSLPGPIPLKWERTWFSTSTYQGPLGHGWHHNYDLALMEEKGAIAIRLADGRPVAFPCLVGDESSFNRAERLWLRRDNEGYALTSAEGAIYYFSPSSEQPGLFNLVAIGQKAVFERILFYYDNHNRLSRIIDCAGREITLSYNRYNQIERIYLPHPDQCDQVFCAVHYSYKDGNLVCVQDALEQPWLYRYEHNLLVQETYRNGLNFYFRFDEYSPNGRCVETWGDEGIYYRHISYDLAQGTTQVADSLGGITRYHHDGVLPFKIIDPLGNNTLIYYNDYAQVIKETDALGYTTEVKYDDWGNKIAEQQADGAKRCFEFDAQNNLIQVEDAIGGRWQYEYNSTNQLIKEIDPLGSTTSYEYYGSKLYKVAQPGDVEYRFNYDAQLNLHSLQQTGAGVLSWQYDRLGRLTCATDVRGNQRLFRQDLLGRVFFVAEPDGNERHLKFDALNNLTEIRDRYYQVQLSYQGLGRLASRSQGGVEIKFHYDKEERLTAIANEQNNIYQFELDATGEITAEQGFDGLTRRFVRDALGRVHKILRPNQGFSIYRYDAMSRVIEVRHHTGEYENFTYRADGALMSAINNACTIEFDRDLLGNVIQETRDGTYWVKSTFNSQGYRTEIISSQGFKQTIGRNKGSEVKSVTLGEQEAVAITYTRNEWGEEIQRDMPGGIQSRWQRDKLGRPTQHAVNSGHTSIRNRTYSWGLDDRLLKAVDALKHQVHYQHDVLGNLTAAHYSDQADDVRLPDAVGNLFKTKNQRDREYGPAGQLLAKHDKQGTTRYQYDAEGNLIAKQEPNGKMWRYSWNGAGFLQQVIRPDDTCVSFLYDALGRRIRKTYQGKITHWFWDGNNPLHEWGESVLTDIKPKNTPHYAADISAATTPELTPMQAQGPPKSSPITWVFDPESFAPMGKIQDEQFYPIVTDYLGAPVAMFDPDGRKIWSADISIWGALTQCKGERQACPFRWPGQYEDEETGLYYNRFRYYDPDAGIYVSQDPIRLFSDTTNFYAYIPDPNIWIDPFGLAKAKCEVIVRRVNADEAAQMIKAKGLVQKPGSKSAKWVSVGRGQDTLKKKGHEKLVTMEVKPGTIDWLKKKGINFDDVAGEASAPKNVLLKDNEAGAMGIGNDLLEEFNQRVTKVSST